MIAIILVQLGMYSNLIHEEKLKGNTLPDERFYSFVENKKYFIQIFVSKKHPPEFAVFRNTFKSKVCIIQEYLQIRSNDRIHFG